MQMERYSFFFYGLTLKLSVQGVKSKATSLGKQSGITEESLLHLNLVMRDAIKN